MSLLKQSQWICLPLILLLLLLTVHSVKKITPFEQNSLLYSKDVLIIQ